MFSLQPQWAQEGRFPQRVFSSHLTAFRSVENRMATSNMPIVFATFFNVFSSFKFQFIQIIISKQIRYMKNGYIVLYINHLYFSNRLLYISPYSTVLPKLDLNAISKVLSDACAVVAVDTGLAHLAAALCQPVISIYGPSDPDLTGTTGKNLQLYFRADSNATADTSPDEVWSALNRMIQPARTQAENTPPTQQPDSGF